MEDCTLVTEAAKNEKEVTQEYSPAATVPVPSFLFFLFFVLPRKNKERHHRNPHTEPQHIVPFLRRHHHLPYHETAPIKPHMCIGNEVVAMLKRGISSCSCSGDSSVIEEDTDKEGLPTLSPKLEMGLSRQLTTRPAFSGSSASVDVGVDSATFPAASERLKPQPFRRKDPAPHFQAAVRGDTQDLDKYLSHGGDPDSRDEQGWALLHHATVSLVGFIAMRGAHNCSAWALDIPRSRQGESYSQSLSCLGK